MTDYTLAQLAALPGGVNALIPDVDFITDGPGGRTGVHQSGGGAKRLFLVGASTSQGAQDTKIAALETLTNDVNNATEAELQAALAAQAAGDAALQAALDAHALGDASDAEVALIEAALQAQIDTLNTEQTTQDTAATTLAGRVTALELVPPVVPEVTQAELDAEVTARTAADLLDEKLANKVTALSATSTDDEYPSAKTVFDALALIKTTGQTLAPYAAAFAGLPAIPADTDGVDIRYNTILTADDIGTGDADNPQYPKGMYLTGANQAAGWNFAFAFSDEAIAGVLDDFDPAHPDYAVPKLQSPDVLNRAHRPLILVETQAEAQTTDVLPGQAIRIGSGTNLLGIFVNYTNTTADWTNPSAFVPYHEWRGAILATDGASPAPDNSRLWFSDWTIGTPADPTRERSHYYSGVLQATEAEWGAMTTAQAKAVEIVWDYYQSMEDPSSPGNFVWVKEKAASTLPVHLRLLADAANAAYEHIIGIENDRYLDDTPGVFPTPVAGYELARGVIQANRADSQAIKDAAKVKVSHWRAVDTGAGPKWLQTDAVSSDLEIIRYTADGAIQDKNHRAIFETGADNMTLPVSSQDRLIQLISEGPATIITADGTEQFTGPGGTTTDSTLNVNETFQWATLLGRGAAAGWSQYVGQVATAQSVGSIVDFSESPGPGDAGSFTLALTNSGANLRYILTLTCSNGTNFSPPLDVDDGTNRWWYDFDHTTGVVNIRRFGAFAGGSVRGVALYS